MRSYTRPLTCAILTTFFLLLLAACGASGSNGLGAPATTISIALTGPTTVALGGQSQYAATVTGSTDDSVTWSVNGVAGGNATVGSISAQGLYLAPVSAPQSSKVTITATSVASPSSSQSLGVALSAPAKVPSGASPVTLLLNGPTSVTLGTSAQYLASVTGTSNTAVDWSVNGVAGGSATDGLISATGIYTAPASAPSSSPVTIIATSVADPSASQSVAVNLVAPAGGGSEVTLSLSGPTKVTLGGSAHYAATVTGSSNTAVTWSVNGVVGGATSLGTISQKGAYAAPAINNKWSKVNITATSVAEPSVSQTLAVALAAPVAAPPVTLTLSGAISVTLGTSSQYAAKVSGSSNTGVTWSVDGVVGGNSAYGSISTSGRYTAPATAPQGSKVTIKATSAADSAVAQSLAVTLSAPPPPTGGGPVTLTLSGATSVNLGSSSQYVATVSGSSNTGVTWTVNGVKGGNATDGTISASGLYKAPATAPQPATVTITATSAADSAVAQSLAVTLSAPPPPTGGGPVTLTLSGATSVNLGSSSQYVATVSGSSNTGVTWTVNGVKGGNATDGTISASGLYKAPATAPQPSTVTITATSVADTTVAKSLVTTLTAPPPAPVTLILTGATSVTLGSSSQYLATVSGSSNTGVTWTVNGVEGGNATDGTISTSGLYTAPTTAPQPATVTITATSVADTSVEKSLVTTLVAPTPSGRIPANAISSGPLDGSTKWQWSHDAGTPGTSQGSSVYPITGLSADNAAREFYMTYTARAGEIYHLSFAKDVNATHFVYDAYVYVVDPSQLANLEMDMNDVMADGQTVILGTQCSVYSKSWEYTLQSGGGFHWHSSNIPCNPETWSAKTWHHIQIASHRDNIGTATYDWVGVDGVYTNFQNASGNSSRPLGWALGDLLINFQIDGSSAGSGSNTIYTHQLTIYRW